jgi:hypothetical protein
MWRGCRRFFLAAALLSGTARAQSGMPVLQPGELAGLEVLQTASFAGTALYGYINGGADLYHEYGFERLTVQELRLTGETYSCEVYRMRDPAGAFGIFSVSRGACTPADSLPSSSCFSPHVVQWAQDRYFLRIASTSGSPTAGAGGLRLARVLRPKISDVTWTIPPVAVAAGGTPRTVILVRGVLGMQNGFDRWSRLLEGVENFEAVIVSREDPTGETAAGEFRFEADTDIDRFSRACAATGTLVRSVQKSGRRLLVLEAESNADSLWSALVETP